MSLTVGPVGALNGQMRPPSDKSMTHRAYMLGAIAKGPSLVASPLRAEDCESTLECLRQLGLRAEWQNESHVRLTPADPWSQPSEALDCGNSGTTMRLLSGLLASRPLHCRLVGDESLSRRPMDRIIKPLQLMGAEVRGTTPPLEIIGHDLHGIDYVSPVASAQVKSCVLLAGLRASGRTSVVELAATRDHTERMLMAAGVPVLKSGPDGLTSTVSGGFRPDGFEFAVPGDISSAAFFMVAAAILPGSELTLESVGVNPLRAGILEVFADAGVLFKLQDCAPELGEPVSHIQVRSSRDLRPIRIEGNIVPRLVDEIPVLAVLATQCHGWSQFLDVGELRVKESDRIAAVCQGLSRMGAKVELLENGFAVQGPVKLKGATIQANGDHRIAMAFAIAGLIADGATEIEGAECIRTSFPEFESELGRLCIV